MFVLTLASPQLVDETHPDVADLQATLHEAEQDVELGGLLLHCAPPEEEVVFK